MEKILLITTSPKLGNRLGDALDSTDPVVTVPSWTEAHRLVSKSSPAAVVIGKELAQPAMVTEVVRLNDALTKDGKAAYLLTDSPEPAISEWTQLFDSVEAVIDSPSTPREWNDLADLLQAHLGSSPSDPSEASHGPESDRDDEDSPQEIIVRLPDITTGSLEKVGLGRVCYSLAIRESTGVLQLRSGKALRRFGFADGRFVQAPDLDDADALTSAFAWPDGEFEFDSRHSISGAPQGLFALVMHGLRNYRQQRQIMQDLMPRLQTYPVATQLWDKRRTQMDWDVLSRFVDLCGGQHTLETVFAQLGGTVTEAFCSAVFARDTDLVVFQSEAAANPIVVQYDQMSRASTSRPGTKIATAQNKKSKSQRATGSGRKNLERELQEFLNAMESMTPHEVFGLWEGCGRELVKQTYYSMVKEHHPDIYGGNVSANLRRLAQRIFIGIREAYTSLLKTETKQTVPPPDSVDLSNGPGKRRQKLDTLHPGQNQRAVADSDRPADRGKKQKRQPGRPRRDTTPIGLGSTPSEAHPEFTSSEEHSTRPRRQTTPSPSKPDSKSRRTRRTSSAGNTRKKRPSTSKPRRRTSSAGGRRDTPNDPDWRRERLERLERSSTRPRRATPISASKGTIPSPKSKPKPAQNAFNTGYKKFKNKTYRKALPHFERAHDKDPNNGLYMTFLAYCLFQVDPDQIKRSKQLLMEAIKTENRQALPDAHLFLGKILKVQGKEDRAYRHFKKALELNPGARDAQREIRLYEKRKGIDSGSNEDSGFFKKLFKK